MFTKVEVLRHMTWSMLCGIAVVAGFRMAQQDTLGLEGYVTYLRRRTSA